MKSRAVYRWYRHLVRSWRVFLGNNYAWRGEQADVGRARSSDLPESETVPAKPQFVSSQNNLSQAPDECPLCLQEPVDAVGCGNSGCPHKFCRACLARAKVTPGHAQTSCPCCKVAFAATYAPPFPGHPEVAATTSGRPGSGGAYVAGHRAPVAALPSGRGTGVAEALRAARLAASWRFRALPRRLELADDSSSSPRRRGSAAGSTVHRALYYWRQDS